MANELPVVEGLSANLVLPRLWAIRQWYYSDPLWYYHRPGKHEAPANDTRFFDLIDPELRPLCKLLHDAGIVTTPSCQGHFYARERFEKIWQMLLQDRRRIRGPGREVRDSESDRAVLFQDRHYELPWCNFRDFYRDAAGHQGTGFLGIALPFDRMELFEALRDGHYHTPRTAVTADDYLTLAFGMPTISITVQAETPDQRQREWRVLTAWFQAALEPVGV